MSTTAVFERLAVLLKESLIAWQCRAHISVLQTEPHAIRVHVSDPEATINIERAPAEMPFRWIVETGGRKRAAASVVGVLRIVRQSVAPDYQPAKVRIAQLPDHLA